MDTSATGSTRWTVTTAAEESSTVCIVRYDQQEEGVCGPNEEFTSSLAGQDENIHTSTLNVKIGDFNGTTVECSDQALSIVGSENICIVGKLS